MIGQILLLARTELLRFVRRRETPWIVLGSGLGVLLLPACFAGPFVHFGDSADFGSGLGALPVTTEFALRLGVLFEAFAILQALPMLVSRSLHAEMESRSWSLLRVSPFPIIIRFFGKGLGATAIGLLLHAYLFSLLACFLPFTCVTLAGLLDRFFLILLLAVTLVPNGMLNSVSHRNNRLSVIAFTLAAGRLLGAYVVLHAFLRPEARAAGVLGFADGHLRHLFGWEIAPEGGSFANPFLVGCLSVLVQALFGALTLFVLSRHLRRQARA